VISVAGYCRVSTSKEDQINSFEAQQRYFRSYIEGKPNWTLYEVYADEGITGTSTKNRTQFNRMIQDAQSGRFQTIITKEVSRFSRNILDTIRYTRQLKAVGVNVLFLCDGIDTSDPDAELRLSIMASIAQEESRKTSDRVVWGQTRQMERGVVFGRSMLGYDVSGGTMKVNPEGAEIVRTIFQKYVHEQMSCGAIAAHLQQEGYRTFSGGTKWNPSVIAKILRNEKYAGDLVQKKTYTPNYLTHEKKTNRGAVPLIRIGNHHEPIIPRTLWDAAQCRLQCNHKHASDQTQRGGAFLFSGKIRCGLCGSPFVSRIKKRKDGTGYRRWCCAKAAKEGSAGCGIGILLRDDDAEQMLQTALANLPLDVDMIVQEVSSIAVKAIRTEEQESAKLQTSLKRQWQQIQRKKQTALDSYFSGEITKEEMQTMKDHYDLQLRDLETRMDTIKPKTEEDTEQTTAAIKNILAAILNGNAICDAFFRNLIESILVRPDRILALKLNCLEMVFIYRK